jgi:hypothetical protein
MAFSGNTPSRIQTIPKELVEPPYVRPVAAKKVYLNSRQSASEIAHGANLYGAAPAWKSQGWIAC